jgi:hypothetical protein
MNVKVEDLLRDAGRAAPPTTIDVRRAVERGRTLRRRRQAMLAGAAVLVLVVGLSLTLHQIKPVKNGRVPGSVAPITASATSDAVLILTPRDKGDDSRTGPQAIVSGDLQRDGECLLFSRSNEVIVWPPGTRWSAEDDAVVLPDGLRVRPGDAITGAGGHYAATRVGLNQLLDTQTAADRAATCVLRNNADIAVFNPYSPITKG